MADTNQILEQILSEIQDNNGGFKSSIRRTVSQSVNDVEDKIKKLLTKSERNIRNVISQKIQGSNRNYGNVIGNIEGNVGAIKDKAANIAKGVDNLNSNITTLASLLQQIEGHINQNISQNSPTNSSNNTSNNTTIETTVKDILTELKGIHTEVIQMHGGQNSNFYNPSTIDNIRRLNELKTARNLDEEIRKSEDHKVLKELREAKKSGKGVKDAEDEYIKHLRKRKKESDYEDKLKKRAEGGRGYVAASITKKITDPFISFVKDKPDSSKLIDKGVDAIEKFGPYGAIASSILQAAKALFDLGAKQDKATTEFARAVGGFKQGKITAGRSVGSMIETADRRRGYTAEAAYSAMTEIAEARGRTTERLSPEALKSAIDLRRFGIGADVINNFDTFGKSIEDTDKYFAKLYSEVSKKGLSFKNVSKAVNDNLKAAQSHTFANGLRGLEAMAERSVQLKYNMQQVFQFADKVSDIEGAIGTAANLSVLGGSFAQFSNPMQMMYEGLNDMEALQKRIESTFGRKAYWNQEKGQIDMTALDREFVKQAAKSMGVDPNEMLSMSYNQARRERVGKQIGKGIGNDTSEYIKNIAELDKNGRAFVNLNGKNIAVSELNETHKEQLQKESERKSKAENTKLGDIYQNTMSITDKMDNLLTYLQEKLGFYVYKIYTKWFLGGDKDYSIEARGTGDIDTKNKREELFARYEGRNPENYAKRLANMSSSEVETAYSRLQAPKAANGISPYFTKPGDGGILGGRSHLKGGNLGKYGNTAWEAEAGEYLINKNSSSVYKNELNKIQNGTFNPYSYANQLIKNDMAKYFSPMKVAEVQKPIAQNEANVANNGLNGRIKIDIPETITINLAGGEKIGDYDVREIIMAYVDKFMKEATMRKNFSGFNKEEFYNKSDVI